MSITAPEAHYAHLPEKVTRGAEEYVDSLADLGSIMTTPIPEVDATTQTVHQAVVAETPPHNNAHRGATERLKQLGPREQARAVQLAKTALIASMANNLLEHGQDQSATAESRRLAIQLAHSALGRHYAKLDHKRSIARRHL